MNRTETARETLAQHTVAELRDLAREAGIVGRSRMRKAELVEALLPTTPADEATPAPSEGQTIRERLAELPTRELREIAASLAISHRSGMVREQLIAALAGHPTTPAILPAPADSPEPREQGFGVTTVSINGGESTWPERFDTIAAAKREVRYMTRGVTSVWRVWITGPGGARVVMGTRDGYNATGKGWVWRSVR